jgi:hypothetical protein
MRRLRQMRRMRLARLRRLRRLRRLLLVNWTLPRLLRRNHVPTKSIAVNCHGRVLLDPARFAFRKSGNRFPEKTALHQNAKAKLLQSEAIWL